MLQDSKIQSNLTDKAENVGGHFLLSTHLSCTLGKSPQEIEASVTFLFTLIPSKLFLFPPVYLFYYSHQPTTLYSIFLVLILLLC
jgi:hypothetical protein